MISSKNDRVPSKIKMTGATKTASHRIWRETKHQVCVCVWRKPNFSVGLFFFLRFLSFASEECHRKKRRRRPKLGKHAKHEREQNSVRNPSTPSPPPTRSTKKKKMMKKQKTRAILCVPKLPVLLFVSHRRPKPVGRFVPCLLWRFRAASNSAPEADRFEDKQVTSPSFLFLYFFKTTFSLRIERNPSCDATNGMKRGAQRPFSAATYRPQESGNRLRKKQPKRKETKTKLEKQVEQRRGSL